MERDRLIIDILPHKVVRVRARLIVSTYNVNRAKGPRVGRDSGGGGEYGEKLSVLVNSFKKIRRGGPICSRIENLILLTG